MPSLNKHSIKTYNYRKYTLTIIFIAIIAVLGVIILNSSHASVPYASIEASTGALTGSASTVSDGNASNGSYVQFGSVSSGTTASGCYNISSDAKVATTCSGGCEYNGTVAPCIGSSTTGASGWGAPTFDDEFNETSLDASRWIAVNWDGNNPANVAESGGNLILTAPSAGSQALVTSDPTLGAGSDSYYLPVGGVVEARINMPNPTTCVWATFWATSNNGNWPAAGEVDIIEGNPSSTTVCNPGTSYHVNYHDSSGGPSEYNYGSVDGSFHTYTFVRGSGNNGYKVYLDGNQVAQWTSGDNGGDEAIELSDGNSNGQFPDQMIVDYVRAWQ